MAKILEELNSTIIAGIVVLIVMIIIVVGSYGQGLEFDRNWWAFFFRWLHVLSGVMWIGLLWYFNFVQIPSMGSIPDEQKPAISKVIAPSALFWFRWSAMSAVVTGLLLAELNGYLLDALALGITDGVARHTAIGFGMWMGIVMWFNVWFIIWPNQKKALGLVDVSGETGKKAGRRAMLFSRANTMLSIPLLYAMVSAQNIY